MTTKKENWIWLIARKGFIVFFLLSLVLNIMNMTLGPFYSPGFSGYYLALFYLPSLLIEPIANYYSINATDDQIFIVASLLATIWDGFAGAVLSIGIRKFINSGEYILIMFIVFPIYWCIVAFAFPIRF